MSPKLVVGAWVGGEYRCIHFRTGSLGQGSRTALPLCGLFIKSVFHDSRFNSYHAKWSLSENSDIEPSMYNCVGYYSKPVENDTIHIIYREEGEEDKEDNSELDENITSEKPDADNAPNNKSSETSPAASSKEKKTNESQRTAKHDSEVM